MPSLFVKYAESSSRLPPSVTPEILAAMSAGPSLALMKCDARLVRDSPMAPPMAAAVAWSGCCAAWIPRFDILLPSRGMDDAG